MSLQIVRRDVGPVTILTLSGKLAGDAGTTLWDTVESLLKEKRPQLLIDLKQVTFVDSGSLGTLLALRGAVAEKGGTLKLLGVNARISDLLVTTRLTMVFDSYETEADALTSFPS
jgi:anti-sigma B factor antagonist